MGNRPTDFKSVASTGSATPAHPLLYRVNLEMVAPTATLTPG
jgi:hypothetical protein